MKTFRGDCRVRITITFELLGLLEKSSFFLFEQLIFRHILSYKDPRFVKKQIHLYYLLDIVLLEWAFVVSNPYEQTSTTLYIILWIQETFNAPYLNVYKYTNIF